MLVCLDFTFSCCNHCITHRHVKGISLSLEQYNALVELLPQIETALQSKGETVSRPSYADSDQGSKPFLTSAEDGSDQSDAEDDVEKDDPVPDDEKTSSKLDKFKYSKKNHEATSDEED